MQTMTMPQTMVSMLQSAGRISQNGAVPMAQGTGGEGFAQLIQQLLGQTICAQNQDEDAQEQGTQMAADMIAQLFGSTSVETTQQMLLNGQMQNQGAIEATQGDTAQTSLQMLMSAIQITDGKPDAKTAQLMQKIAAFQPENFQNDAELQTISALQTQTKLTGETAENLLSGQSDFQNSILAAQKLLNSDQGKSTQTEDPKFTDVEQLQSQVDSGQFFQSMKVDKSLDSLPDADSVMAQIKSGIKDNVAQGKNEFIVKLKPDGLGEITVKMVEAESKISLSIVTSNPQVAKLINGELAGLQETLHPYHANIEEVVAQTNSPFDSAAQNGQFMQQDAAGQFQQFRQQNAHSTVGNEHEDELEETTLNETISSISELDTYI